MQLFTDVSQKVAKFATDNATTLLTAGGVAGTIATAALAAQAAFQTARKLQEKRFEIIQQMELEPGEPDAEVVLPTKEKLLVAAPYFIPPVVVGGLTITSIIMSHRMSAQKIAGLTAAYALAERNFGEYKDKVAEKLTGPKKTQIDDELAQDAVNKTSGSEKMVFVEGEVLCLDKPTGRYFNSTMETIKQAVNTTNNEVHLHGFALASFFYDELGLTETAWSEQVGFNAENLLELTYSTTLAPGNKPCIVIEFARMPKTDYDPKLY